MEDYYKRRDVGSAVLTDIRREVVKEFGDLAKSA
jgi:hypothetical protein